MPLSVLAKSNMGTINIKVGETYYVSHGYDNSYYTVSGSWFKTGGNAFAITGSNSGNGKCEIKGTQVGTSTLNWTGYVYANGSGWDVEAYWTVNVTEDPIIKVSSITLNTSSLSLKVRQEETLTATIRPSDATDKSVTWSIDNSNVATVGPSGTVKAKAEGNATITCKANDGSGVSATCTLKVEGELPEPETMSIKQVAAGGSHTMILMTDGSLWACGKNDHGQLGDGTTTNCNKPKQVMKDVAYVSAGSGHTLIVKEDGTLWACGWNEYGQLGDGAYIDCDTPEQIMTDVATVSAGYWHTLILKTDGSLWACGSNSNGQLGDGTKTNRNKPKRITTGVVTMSAGATHTMIVKNDGSLWTCGSDESGSLAGGAFFTGSSQWVLTPKQAMTDVKKVAAGNGYSMIIKQDNSLWTCGRDSYGCLGVGSQKIYCNTEQIMTGVKDVSAYDSHTLILKTDGSLWACGWNYRGQIGDGTTTNCSTPKKIMTDVSIISAGFMHSVAVKTDGTLWAWGRNDSGQLGDGTNTDRYTPVEINIDILIASITLNKSSLTLQEGQEEKLSATISPSNAKDKTVTWSSSDISVATVDDNGKVTAKSKGSATITCMANDGSGVQATCFVTVTEPIVLVTSIILNKSTIPLQIGQSEVLTATVKPDNATNKTVTWSSSDTSVAIIDSNGKVTAMSKGNATITCTAIDGSGVQATGVVTVSNPKPDKIVLPSEASVSAGKTITLTPTVTPANAEYTLTWSSDDETIATVSKDGVVTGIKKGRTFINVETDNGKTAYCKLTVTAPEPIKIELPKNVTVTVGETITLTPTITPEGAETTLTWTSDDVSVARIDTNGVLTGVAEGLALVTVSTSNGLTSNACKVIVEPDPSGISTVMMDGKADVPIFTPSGQRLAAPRKGINIVGGKKVIVK